MDLAVLSNIAVILCSEWLNGRLVFGSHHIGSPYHAKPITHTLMEPIISHLLVEWNRAKEAISVWLIQDICSARSLQSNHEAIYHFTKFGEFSHSCSLLSLDFEWSTYIRKYAALTMYLIVSLPTFSSTECIFHSGTSTELEPQPIGHIHLNRLW